MGVDGDEILHVFGAHVGGPYAGPGEEEALLGSEAVDHAEGSLLHRVLQSTEGDVDAAVVADVLAESLLAVDELAGNGLHGAEVVLEHLRACVVVLLVEVGPPVVLVAGLVELAALVVEAMAHLVSDHAADGTVVDGVVGIGVKEWGLQDGCGEADLVGGWVVVGIDGLGRHQPLVLVDGLVHLAVDLVLHQEGGDVAQVLVERETLVYLQAAVVLPFVGIADFHDEVAQFVLGLQFRLGTHPCGLVDAL